MARPESVDSNLPKEPGNEVCDIINCVAIYYEKGASGNAYLGKKKVSSTGFKETEVTENLKETVMCVYLAF